MKNRTKELDEIWANCVSMWRYVAKQCIDGDITDEKLNLYKKRWVEKHKPLELSCYFCTYATISSNSCDTCPGRLVDSTFSCCEPDYHFSHKPIKFYNKIKYLYYNYYLKGKVVNHG